MSTINVEPVQIYNLEFFFRRNAIFEQFSLYRGSNIQRTNGEFAVIGGRTLSLIALVLHSIDVMLGVIKIGLLVRDSKIGETPEFIVTFVFEIFILQRGLNTFLSERTIVQLFNRVDGIFPQARELQERMRIPQFAQDNEKRFYYLNKGVSISLLLYVTTPLLRFLYFYEWDGTDMLDIYHPIASWLPFGIKTKLKYYPYIYLCESFVACNGITMLMAWDRNFVLVVTQLRLHYQYLAGELATIRAEASKDPLRAADFYRKFKSLIAHYQHMNSLVDCVNDIFKFTILFSDGVLAGSICLHLYVIMNGHDIVSVVTFVLPCFIQICVSYDISNQGESLSEATSNIKEVLYSHNWFEGSISYRKYITMWMQHANVPRKLTGFNVFDLNMEHFKSTMMLTYQMLTFLRSR